MESTYGLAPRPDDGPEPVAGRIEPVRETGAAPPLAPTATGMDDLTKAGAVLTAIAMLGFAAGWFMGGLGIGVFGGVPAAALSLLTAALVAALGAATNGVLAWHSTRDRRALAVAVVAILTAIFDTIVLWG